MEPDLGIAAVWMGLALVASMISIRLGLIVLGQHGNARIRRFFLGSTSERVTEHCHCTVMIVK